MRALSIFVLLLSFVLLGCTVASDPQLIISREGPLDTGIVGGRSLKKTDSLSKYVVMIYSENDEGISQTCTGTIISDSAILTAAHCVTKDVSKTSAFFSPNPFAEDNPQSVVLTDVITHENYLDKNKLGRNDLAILRFAGGLPKGAAIAKIAPSGIWQLKLKSLKALGFGQTGGGDDLANTSGLLRIVEIFVPNSYPNLPEFEILQDGAKGVCHGDSGGPALARVGGVIQLFAVASAIIDPGNLDLDSCHYRSIFTNIEYYKDWIQSNLR